jgi:hypothetical protein
MSRGNMGKPTGTKAREAGRIRPTQPHGRAKKAANKANKKGAGRTGTK